MRAQIRREISVIDPLDDLEAGAFAGIAALYGQSNIAANRQLKILHEFVDFDCVRAELRGKDA